MSSIILIVLFASLSAYWLAIRFYGRRLEKWLGIDPNRPTPAHTRHDGIDFLPSRHSVLFAHHFAAIAGAGPIIGPTLAAAYGIVPCLLWVVIGAIFLGGVQDLATLFISIREKGQSIAGIARHVLGPAGYLLTVGFLLISLILITATFLNLSVTALTSRYPAEKVGLVAPPVAHLRQQVAEHPGRAAIPFRSHPWMPSEIVVPANESANSTDPASRDPVLYAKIGGIASSSVLFITGCAPLLGWLIYRRKTSSLFNYTAAAILCGASVVLGLRWPVSVNAETWRWWMTAYVFLASAIPVWLLLMPRDFVNVQILYAGLGGVFAALLTVGLFGPLGVAPASAPADLASAIPIFDWSQGLQYVGWLWPLLFITISCGAISGFHCLVAAGTTARQLSTEAEARPVVYNAMLLESLLAVTVVLTLLVGLAETDYLRITYGDKNPVLAIALATGSLLQQAFVLPVWLGTVIGILLLEGFVVTTLDAAVRLNRYLLEELWRLVFVKPPSWLTNRWTNTVLAVAAMYLLSRWNSLPVLWKVFGTANQMMGALALLVASVWLHHSGRRYWFALAPSLIMFATTLAAAWMALRQNWLAGNAILTAACILLIGLAIGVMTLGWRQFQRPVGPPV